MFTEPKVMEIYCIADDFCKNITSHQEKHMIEKVHILTNPIV